MQVSILYFILTEINQQAIYLYKTIFPQIPMIIAFFQKGYSIYNKTNLKITNMTKSFQNKYITK